MDMNALTKVAIAAGIAFGIYKFVGNAAVKTGALGVLAVIVAKQIPYVNEAL
jgi:hypothetical protein